MNDFQVPQAGDALAPLDPASDAVEQVAALPGVRLMSIEVLNWGTFDRHIWRLDLGGGNGLLTGQNGAGKSTLIDAITTLLVPPQRISYNKAGQAERDERDLRSYVLGTYKSERAATGGGAKPVSLRKSGSTYAVILGRFHNAGYNETTTLAQGVLVQRASRSAGPLLCRGPGCAFHRKAFYWI
jgi:uncharacterized protein YPO0396